MSNGAEHLISGEDSGFALDFTDNSSAISLPLNVVGVDSIGQVGTVDVKEGVGVFVSGAEGLGLVGNSFLIFIWSQVNTNQSPSWAAITNAQSPNWAAVTDNQSPNWTQIAA